jgi:hypothetical protein
MYGPSTSRRLLTVVLAAATAAGVVLASPSPALATDHYERLHNYYTGHVAHAASSLVGQPVTQRVYNGSTRQQWERIPVSALPGEDQVYLLRNRYSGLCLDVGGGHLNGAPIIQMPCDHGDPEQWWFREQDPDLPVWHIVNGMGWHLDSYTRAPLDYTMLQSIGRDWDEAQMWQMWG